ncbi:MAG: molybdopterin converting factor subunit 1 [Myxococcota bacterium]|jgi:MoaE-MoaD fusion protein|nr:molybdopterin converting factor subunit 1 [Myxococcota bacterium]
MKVKVRLFGSLREEAGQPEIEMELDSGARVADLRGQLARRYPSVEALGDRLRMAVNLEFSSDEGTLAEGDEVALLPPVAGGSGAERRCTISEKPLDEAAVAARVAGLDTGGVVTFVGTVRDRARGHEIEFLEYEAYPEMAEREMEKIADEAAERWPGTRVAIAHRVGHLVIGDAAVVVVACAPHRGEAFEACRFAIDTLKVTVPIWKKEKAVDGAYWVDDHA